MSEVSTDRCYTVGSGAIHVCLVDCGTKINIVRMLVKRGCKVTVVPYEYRFQDGKFDGIMISNGPGDPSKCVRTIENIREHIQGVSPSPLFGICLGHQLLALAAGAKIQKMKYGNRGYNQPVYFESTGKTYMTSQNHGYEVIQSTINEPWRQSCWNKNDGSNEGMQHERLPFQSVQFHPEARGGPHDTAFMFQTFYKQCQNHKYGVVKKNKVLLLGSGGLSIGQAGEFDYSGSQAVKAFKALGCEVCLINPNIASNQTRQGFADKVYYLPVEPDVVKEIIEIERPEYISLSFGGQTALNCGLDVDENGTLSQHGITVLGTPIDGIRKTEDRELFARAMLSIGEKTPRSRSAGTIADAKAAAAEIGYPVLVRAAYALGGLGSGFCATEAELVALLESTLTMTSQVLIDEDLRGWKEIEYEVMRDKNGNSITVCNMENFDPLGIHTGDSIVVAPSQTLTNDEYNMLREASLKIADYLGIVGECNVQLTLDPKSAEYRIIEVNPRLSRSSALASKATGYPIAAVAAELCYGKELHCITNEVTGSTSANFEPSLDYIVVKVPKWDSSKFPGVDDRLGSAMQSVGEVMAIGRTFEEAFQKGLRMATGHEFEAWGASCSVRAVEAGLRNPTPDRVRLLAHALFEHSLPLEWLHELTKIDMWFLTNSVTLSTWAGISPRQLSIGAKSSTDNVWKRAKSLGFSDAEAR